MIKHYCDKCDKEIMTDVVKVFNYELCFDCVKAVNDFITQPSRSATMDEIRDFCENFSKNCEDCPFYEKGFDSWEDCKFKTIPSNWTPEEETFRKLLDYKVKHPDWRKKE